MTCLLKKINFALALSISASFFVVATPQIANSQGFFERIFKKQPRRQQTLLPPPVKIKKVSAPKYFGYRVAPVKKIAFGALVNAVSAKLILAEGVDVNANADSTVTGTIANTSSVFEPEDQDFLIAAATLGGLDIRADKAIGKAVVDHYLENSRFLWIENGKPSFKAKMVISLMSKADEVGLMAKDYAVQLPIEGSDSELINFEMNLSLAAVRYALDARNGKVNPNKLSGYHDFPKSKYTAAIAISEMTAAVSPSKYLALASPTNEKFRLLRKTLAQLEFETGEVIKIAEDTLIKPGKSHAELVNVVAAIRDKASTELLQRHGETLVYYSGTPEFTPELVALVKDFQKEVKLKPDGVVGRNTISKLVDVDPAVKMNRVRLAMERLRWHPREFGPRHVFINQPAYQARYIQDGEEALAMRVIVGKRSNQTTFFYDTIERVEFNPYWGVPQSIIVNEMLPKLRADPSYLDSQGYEVSTLNGRKISSASVDWSTVGGGQVPYNIRQLPGAKNALGELKIMFPNKHAIYMHDTPTRGLFNRTRRALSHGCVRLQNPRGMAAAVLGTSVSTISSKINLGRHNALKLPAKIPVYVAYFTAWPDKNGTVEYFGDIYGRDKHLSKAIAKVAAARDKSV